ncbi:MAG TPA: nickel transporter permease [Methylomirabilota bacterium]|jgi:ABC-type dipeptide/oligopeptide/nickel transport system permease subunit|nr:nickel transporter permease [Methylomirabilota bacterium]
MRQLGLARRLARHRGAAVGLLILGALALMALAAPWLAPRDPIRTAPRAALQAPGGAYWLGSDQLGRDVASRVLHGARISLTVGVIAVTIAVVIGAPIGLVAGFYGGRLDALVMRVMDVLLAFPGILLALAIVSVLTPGLTNVMIAVGLSAVPTYARLVRGSVLSARENLYVEAARAIGSRDPAILARYILPNVVAPLVVTATLGLGTAILASAALSFLGLGSQPPQPEWGRMLSEGRDYLREAWWISTFPGLGIMLTVLGMNLLGDGLRDVLDPRLNT